MQKNIFQNDKVYAAIWIPIIWATIILIIFSINRVFYVVYYFTNNYWISGISSSIFGLIAFTSCFGVEFYLLYKFKKETLRNDEFKDRQRYLFELNMKHTPSELDEMDYKTKKFVTSLTVFLFSVSILALISSWVVFTYIAIIEVLIFIITISPISYVIFSIYLGRVRIDMKRGYEKYYYRKLNPRKYYLVLIGYAFLALLSVIIGISYIVTVYFYPK